MEDASRHDRRRHLLGPMVSRKPRAPWCCRAQRFCSILPPSALSRTISRSTRMPAGSARCRPRRGERRAGGRREPHRRRSRTTAPRRTITAIPSSPIIPASWWRASATRRRACWCIASILPRSSATAPNGASSATAAPTSTPRASSNSQRTSGKVLWV